MKYLNEAINQFSQDVVERAQRNLGSYRTVTDRRGRKKKRRADSSGTLRKSLTYSAKSTSKGTNIAFFAKGNASDYADFVEQGVNGTETKHGSPYDFRGETANTYAIFEWLKKKPVKVRSIDSKGRLGGFAPRFYTITRGKNKGQKGDRLKSLAFAMGKSIAKHGFAPLYYMRDAVNDAIPDWRNRFEQAVIKDIEERLK
jgi:hypothetical protein